MSEFRTGIDTGTTLSAPHHRAWSRRPSVWLATVVIGGLLLWLMDLGTRRLRFRPETIPDGDTTWDWDFFWELVPLMLRALAVTATATVLGFAVAVVLGFLLALGRRSSVRWISWPVALVIEFVRSTPLLVQLFFLFFALPDLGVVLSPLQTLVLGLGVHYATYCSEAYRAGINSVPKGQWEASTALNLDARTKWTRVVIPQAVPNVMPALGNFLIAGFKDAPLGSAVQVTGLLFFAQTVSGRLFRSVEPFTLIGIGFLLVSLPAAWLLRRLEKRIGYERI
jgi:polar amino acid transport system permease protein